MTEGTQLLHFAAQTGTFRHETLDNVEYLVCDSVILKESVMNEIWMTEKVVRMRIDQWNCESVIVDHPPKTADGKEVTANTPEFFATKIIGTSFGAVNDKDPKDGRARVKIEIWIDVDKAERLGFEWIAEKVEAGGQLPVSIGVWTKRIEQAGEFDGKPYTHVALNLTPDHIAIITVGDGACKLESGDCGLSMNAANDESETMESIHSHDACDGATCKNPNDPCNDCANSINTNNELQETEMNLTEKKSIFGFLASLGRKTGVDAAEITALEESLEANVMTKDLYKQLQEQIDREKGSYSFSIVNIDTDKNEVFCYDFAGKKTIKKSFTLNNGIATLENGEITVVEKTSYEDADAAGADDGDESMSENTTTTVATEEESTMTDVTITAERHQELLGFEERENDALKAMRDELQGISEFTEDEVSGMPRSVLEKSLAAFKANAEDDEEDDGEMAGDKKKMKDKEDMKENDDDSNAEAVAESVSHNHDFSGQTGSAESAAGSVAEEADSFAQFESAE